MILATFSMFIIILSICCIYFLQKKNIEMNEKLKNDNKLYQLWQLSYLWKLTILIFAWGFSTVIFFMKIFSIINDTNLLKDFS